MDDLDPHFFVRQLGQCLDQRFLRTLDVGLDDERQGLDLALLHLLEHVLELGRLLLGQLDVTELALAEERDLPRLLLVGKHDGFFAGRRHIRQAEDFDGNRGTGFVDRLAVFVEHGAHAPGDLAGQHDIATLERTREHQHGRHRATTLVEARLDDQTLGRRVLLSLQFKDFGLQQHLLEQFVDTGALLGRNRHEGRIATVLFGNDAFGDQFLLDTVRIGIRLVHLVDRHDQRHPGRLGMVDRFLGLRHHAVVRRHHQDDDVGRLGATGTHRRESLVTRGVEEGEHATVGFDVVGTDVLGNAAGFAGRHLGAPDVVEQRGLAVVDVAHDGNHRRPRLERHILVLGRVLDEEGIRVVQFGGKCLVAHFLDHDHGRFLVQHLVDGDHRTHLHHDLDDFDGLDRHLVGQVRHRDGFGNVDLANDDFGRRLEAALAVVGRVAVLLVTVSPAFP